MTKRKAHFAERLISAGIRAVKSSAVICKMTVKYILGSAVIFTVYSLAQFVKMCKRVGSVGFFKRLTAPQADFVELTDEPPR